MVNHCIVCDYTDMDPCCYSLCVSNMLDPSHNKDNHLEFSLILFSFPRNVIWVVSIDPSIHRDATGASLTKEDF